MGPDGYFREESCSAWNATKCEFPAFMRTPIFMKSFSVAKADQEDETWLRRCLEPPGIFVKASWEDHIRG